MAQCPSPIRVAQMTLSTSTATTAHGHTLNLSASVTFLAKRLPRLAIILGVRFLCRPLEAP